MNNLFIVHFQPLEKYPPVMNLVRYLEKFNGKEILIQVITTANDGKLFSSSIPVYRISQATVNTNALIRLWKYLQFNWSALRLLLKYRPAKILYYETLSSGAVWVYKKFFRRNTDLYIHYHEYNSNEEYRKGMQLGRLLHYLEQQIYPVAKWVSHTNVERMQLFVRDNAAHAPVHRFILPNFPPRAWSEHTKNNFKKSNSRTRFVYVGALAFETTYVKEWAGFIAENPLLYEWDIYSGNFEAGVPVWLDELKAPNIFFRGNIEYESLPSVLPDYDVGIILYKGHIPNYVFNAPNKLFEYIACGLDAWFPPVMTGCLPYVTVNTYPKICAFDFQHPRRETVEKAMDRTGLEFKAPEYYAEDSFLPLQQQILNGLG
ncbi:MAG TPA: hypothetical protein VM012_01175 [Flavitalea sp.]|nr:hypothetical protein [Flavitalea sp.]